MIDPTWISVKEEESGRRRLDMRGDWVRIEIARSLREKKIVIPVLIEDARMPEKDELPASLRALPARNAARIDDLHYVEDVNKLIELMRKRSAERELIDFSDDPYPKPRDYKPEALAQAQLDEVLKDLPRWEIVWKGQTPIELAREFKFPTFRSAIRFMNAASKRIDPYDHHPRWENVYQTLTVRLSTWDSGHIVTDRDYKSAMMLERLYQRFLTEL
jgi:pterin-4a-carbinolamine dehydratase